MSQALYCHYLGRNEVKYVARGNFFSYFHAVKQAEKKKDVVYVQGCQKD